MNAIVRDRYGDGEVLDLEAVDRPVAGKGQVLVRMAGSSVNMGDRLLLRGWPYLFRLALGILGPRKGGLGQDLAGRVEAVGAGVIDLAVGDEVYGEVTGGSTWAEYAVGPAKRLARAPRGVPLVEAGAIPLAATTALQAVRDHGRVGPDHRVLVVGGSGSVGSYAVQIAAALGAEVTAVCSAVNAERARRLGARHTVDYATEDFTRAGEPYDVLIDVAASRPLAECLGVVRPGGTYVAVGLPMEDPWLRWLFRLLGTALQGWFAKQRVVTCLAKPGREPLDALTALVEEGRIAPAYDSRCSLAELPAAMRQLDAGERRGKVLVEVP